MKTAIISDIHGNLRALRAVDRMLEREAPDVVVVGGDLVGSGGRLAEVIDLIRDRGWPCIAGNTDEMLWQPERIDALEARMPRMAKLWQIIRDDIRIAIESIGDERLRWLRALPDRWSSSDVAVVHASPDDKWNAPGADAPDDVFAASCAGLGASMLVYGHIHVPFIRCRPGFTAANAGSVGLPYDGDPRAAFLVMEDGQPSIPRVAYDVEREIRDRVEMAYPHANWIAGILRSASFQPATDR